MILSIKGIPKALIRVQAGLLLGCSHTPEDRFSHDKAHIYADHVDIIAKFGLIKWKSNH